MPISDRALTGEPQPVRYQESAKRRAMTHYGLTWEEVDLPYEKWARIRDAMEAEREFSHDRCPECGRNSVPAEDVPNQALRACLKCGETWFEPWRYNPAAPQISIKYEGGKADGFAASVFSDVTVAYYGPRGEEDRYERTQRTDDKGRTVFALKVGA